MPFDLNTPAVQLIVSSGKFTSAQIQDIINQANQFDAARQQGQPALRLVGMPVELVHPSLLSFLDPQYTDGERLRIQDAVNALDPVTLATMLVGGVFFAPSGRLDINAPGGLGGTINSQTEYQPVRVTAADVRILP